MKRRKPHAAGKSKLLDCVYCFATCVVDLFTRQVICGRCVIEGAPLEFPKLRRQ